METVIRNIFIKEDGSGTITLLCHRSIKFPGFDGDPNILFSLKGLTVRLDKPELIWLGNHMIGALLNDVTVNLFDENHIKTALTDYHKNNPPLEQMPPRRNTLMRSSVTDFWTHVKVENPANPDSCWVYTGSTDVNGYPLYKGIYAHRIVFVIYLESIPGTVRKKTKFDCKCENKACVRRDHFHSVSFPDPEDPRLTAIRECLMEYYKSNRKIDVHEVSKRMHTREQTVRKVLKNMPLYLMLEDVLRYKNNGMIVPITPDTRVESNDTKTERTYTPLIKPRKVDIMRDMMKG